jgi:L-alanine-DL-glutamate epimerase-like enolase superfamily enzyme
MRIERLELVPFALPFREPYASARGQLERRELLLVRLRSSGGPEGLGEAAPLALRGGPDLASIAAELRDLCAPAIEGVKLTLSTLPGLITICAGRGLSRQALAAIDIALHDLAAKAEGEPVWRMLGATRSGAVPCNATLPAGEPSTLAERASDWAARGYTTFKLKLGTSQDSAQVAAVRDAVGPEARIRIDANGVWSAEQAVETLSRIEHFGIELAEQPAANLRMLAEVRRRSRIPIAADESLVSEGDATEAVELGACEVATVKVAKVGGLAAGLAVARVIPCYLSSALDGPVGIAAAAHLAQLIPRPGLAGRLADGLATAELFDGTIASSGPELRDAALHVSEEPGLGVEIDELALRRHRLME